MVSSIAKTAIRAARRACAVSEDFFHQSTGSDSMPRLVRLIGITLLLCRISISGAAATGWQHIGNVQRVEKLQDGVELTAGSAKVRITVFRDGVIRVRLAPQSSFPKDFSWAVVESADPPSFKIEDGEAAA